MGRLRAAWSDIKGGRHLDAYVLAIIATLFAALGIVGDIVPDGLKWSAVFAGLAILVLRAIQPQSSGRNESDLLGDRRSFEHGSFSALIKDARQLWIFAPTAINVLSPENVEIVRQAILCRTDGDLKVVTLSADSKSAVALATRQLDDSLQYPLQDFESSLKTSILQLQRMKEWRTVGSVQHRQIDYNPGFSLVAVDAGRSGGRIIVEIHGFRNEATATRMHMTLTAQENEKWFHYWVQQFEEIWLSASDSSQYSSIGGEADSRKND